jgi:hypothetical protein
LDLRTYSFSQAIATVDVLVPILHSVGVDLGFHGSQASFAPVTDDGRCIYVSKVKDAGIAEVVW